MSTTGTIYALSRSSKFPVSTNWQFRFCRDVELETPLSQAAAGGCLECVRHLIQFGADVNAVDDRGISVLIAGLMSRKSDVVAELLANGAEVNHRGPGGSTALRLAGLNGDLASCRLLLQHGADVDLANDHGDTALSGAAMNGHEEVVQLTL